MPGAGAVSVGGTPALGESCAPVRVHLWATRPLLRIKVNMA